MYCKNCNQIMKDSDIFCSKCGCKNDDVDTTIIVENNLDDFSSNTLNNTTYNTLNDNNSSNIVPANNVNDTNSTNGMAIASLVLGIVSIVFAYFFYLTIPSSIVGIVLATKSKKVSKTSMGTAGLVLSIIGLVLSVLVIALWIFIILFSVSASSFLYDLNGLSFL